MAAESAPAKRVTTDNVLAYRLSRDFQDGLAVLGGGQTQPDQTPPSLAKRLSRTLHRTSKKAGPTAKPFTSNPVRTDAPQPWLHFYNTHGRAAASEAATHQQVQPTY